MCLVRGTPTSNPIPVYREILERFREGELSIGEFTQRYQAVFLEDSGQYDDALWRIFNEAFMAAEFYTDNPRLLSYNPELYLDEKKLRWTIDEVVAQLDRWPTRQ
jgi:hypothetical protein